MRKSFRKVALKKRFLTCKERPPRGRDNIEGGRGRAYRKNNLLKGKQSKIGSDIIKNKICFYNDRYTYKLDCISTAHDRFKMINSSILNQKQV